MVEVATPSKVCFPLVYVFFEVMLMSGIDGIRSCLEDYILLFLFDVCMYLFMDGCMDAWMDAWMDGWMHGWLDDFPDDNKQEILEPKLFNVFC